jgi:hypothetical protein
MATKTNEQVTANPEKASQEEMNRKRAEITAYYKESLTHLKVQLEYEVVLKDIEVARAERIQSQMFVAQAMAEPEEAPQPKRQAAPVAAKAPAPKQVTPPPTSKKVTPPQQANTAGPIIGDAGADWDVDSKTAPPRRRALKTVEG